MKGKLFFILPILILFLAVIIYTANKSFSHLSPDQQKVKDLFGSPSQFVISYLNRGQEDNQLIRNDIWLYPKIGKRISFLAGNLAYSQDYDPTEIISDTTLNPSDFYFEQNLSNLEAILGKENIEPADLPPFFEEDIQTYYSQQAIFVIENNHLTYFQTVGEGKKDDLIAWEKEQDKLETSSNNYPDSTLPAWKNYTNSDLGFSIHYPSDWFLSYGVLSNYDTDYLEKGLDLPELRVKCDFYPYNPEDLIFSQLTELVNSPINISKGSSTSFENQDGPGLGDNVMYLFKSTDHPPIGLLCFSYSQELDSKVLEIIKTFSFID